MPAPARPVAARAAVQFLLGLAMTGVLGAWAFRDVRWPEVWQSLEAAQWGWVVPHVLLLTLVHALRSARYGLLLSRMARVPFRLLNEVLAVGNMLLTLLPLRLGEFARPVLVARRTSLSVSAALAAVTLERLLDCIALAVLLELAVPFIPEGAPGREYLRWLAHALLAGFSGLLAVLLVAARAQRQVVGVVRALLGRVAPGVTERVVERVVAFTGAVRLLPQGAALAGVVLLTLVNWVGYGAATWVLSFAFDAQGGLRLGLLEGLVVLAATALAGFIPAAPGQAGTYQAAVRFSLALFLPAAVVSGVGVVFANVGWLVGVLYQLGLGLLCMATGSFSLREAGLGGGALAAPAAGPSVPATRASSPSTP